MEKNSLNDILADLDFTKKEAEAFLSSLQIVKEEQAGILAEDINPLEEILNKVREATKDEI